MMSPPYSSGDGLPATRREGKRMQVSPPCMYVCWYIHVIYVFLEWLTCDPCNSVGVFAHLYMAGKVSSWDSMHAWGQRQARIYYVYRYVCVKAIIMVVCWNVCMYLWLFVGMFVAGAYTVMVVAWVVLYWASLGHVDSSHSHRDRTHSQATLSSIGTNTMLRGSYALHSSSKCMWWDCMYVCM